jgi:hypothetical protein
VVQKQHGVAVAHVLLGREDGHPLPEKGDEGGVDDGGDDEDPAPAVNAADPAGEGAGEKDAEEQARHDDADGAAALLVGDEVGGDGQGDVGDGGEEADENAACDEPVQAGCDGDEKKRDGGGAVHAHHEGAAFEQVAEGDEGEHAEGVADLGGDGDEAGLSGGGSVGSAHLEQERLVVVDGRDADGAGQPEEWQWSSGCHRGWVGLRHE